MQKNYRGINDNGLHLYTRKIQRGIPHKLNHKNFIQLCGIALLTKCLNIFILILEYLLCINENVKYHYLIIFLIHINFCRKVPFCKLSLTMFNGKILGKRPTTRSFRSAFYSGKTDSNTLRKNMAVCVAVIGKEVSFVFRTYFPVEKKPFIK